MPASCRAGGPTAGETTGRFALGAFGTVAGVITGVIIPGRLSGDDVLHDDSWRPPHLVQNEAAEASGEGGASAEKPAPDVTKRPSRVRKGTEQANWDNAEDGQTGGKICSTCDNEVHSKPGEKYKDWDNDHDPAWRNRDLTGKTRKEVLDDYNSGTRLRCVGCNRADNGSGE